MKKRLVYLFSVVFFVFLGLLQLGLKPQRVEAAYGILHPYSTPVATRGNWYYLDRDSKGTQKIYTVKITAHAVDKDKLYVPSQKYFEKHVYNASEKKRNQFIEKTKNIYAGYNYKKGFNVNNWVSLAGDGVYYIPVTRKVKGKKVKALRIATGAGPYTAAYAYKTKKLARMAK